ncbi:hypothetical protein V6N13_125235 [Hibiscus sabdariffa]|uniref:Uncharacterized protein n=1 Tax=Hibiscus sabdariffa TaxID=183260 RepID=A0ABR2U5A4_9ROSI
MGEIDTKPIEPVQVAISLFGEKSNHLMHRSSGSDSGVEKEEGVEGLEKGLANYRLQMEAKDSAYMEVLRQLEHYKKTTQELSVLLKNSEVERDRYIQECNEVKDRVNELESKMKVMADKLSESAKIREQLSCVLLELKITQADLLSMESQLAAAKDLELKAITQAEMMETSAKMEKERSEELLGRIAELHNAAHISKLAATEAENEKCRIVSEKDAEMEAFKETAFQAQEEIEDLRKRLETIAELENQLVVKSVYIDSLQAKLEQLPNVLGSMENASLDGGIDMNQITQDLEFKERKISDQAFYIKDLETELENAKQEAKNLNCNVEALKSNLEKVQIEMDEVRKRENDEQVEISHIVGHIMISIEEYNSLIRKAEKADEISLSPAEDFNQLTTESENKNEVEALKKELKAAMAKIGLFRNRAEQAATRAEAAEKAKATAEDQLRKWQEQKQRRKAALAALREESAPKQFNPPTIEKLPTNHQPLGQVLNLKL